MDAAPGSASWHERNELAELWMSKRKSGPHEHAGVHRGG
jgi:hypothetical protein